MRHPLRLHGRIARDLGTSIVAGRLAPGDLLDDEISASSRLQVSRSAYREAVRILAAKGLVESRPRIGTRVSQPEHWHLLDPDVLSWIFASEPDEKLVVDLFELRNIVEPRAAALAAERRSVRHLESMSRSLEGMAKHALSTAEGRLADQAFHGTLLAASGNAFIVTLTSSIAAAVTWTTVFKQRKNALQRDAVPDHARVLEAVRDGDPDAAHAAMTDLVNLALADTTRARTENGR